MLETCHSTDCCRYAQPQQTDRQTAQMQRLTQSIGQTNGGPDRHNIRWNSPRLAEDRSVPVELDTVALQPCNTRHHDRNESGNNHLKADPKQM